MPAPLVAEPISPESFREQLRSAAAEDERVSPFEEFPAPPLAWLGLAPAWPLALAERGFPLTESGLATGPDVHELLARLAAAGICEARTIETARPGLPTLEYSMNAGQKEAARKHLRDQRKFNHDALREQYRRAAAALRAAWLGHTAERMGGSAAAGPPAMDGPLARWVKLAEHAQSARTMAEGFLAEVTAALAAAGEQRTTAAPEGRAPRRAAPDLNDPRNERRDIATPEAARWIETAEALAVWFAGPLEASLATAKRKRELFHRRAYDHRALANYFSRAPLDEAFHALLDGPDDQWALHYVGQGGSGKTMFLRHVTTRLGPARDVVLARIDFDHLNPDYPERAPGLFLKNLAEELRLYEEAGMRSSISAFESFDQRVDRLHERSVANADAGYASGEGVESAEFRGLVGAFCEALREIAQGRRIVLILDTCEELAKLRPDGTLPKSVEVTFRVLEMVHDEIRSLRVIFSGRRPLAGGGVDWTWLGARGTHRLPERSYLRLQEIPGFSRSEAHQFLGNYRLHHEGSERRVAPDLWEAILGQSQVARRGQARCFAIGPPAAQAEPEEARFNPYDLDLFASWSCLDETLQADKLQSGAHVYVRERILGRRSPLLTRLLPAIVVAGRFDRQILEALLGGEEDKRVRLSAELTNQEWIDLDRASAPENPVWLVEPIMQRRLWAYYRQEAAGLFGDARRQVAELLCRLTLERPWSALSPGYFQAVFLALHDQPEAAADWWMQVELRIATDGEWNWARSLVETLLAEEGSDPADLPSITGSRLHAAVLALHAAERTHTAPREAAAIWSEVAASADRHPTAEGQARLQCRAAAGKLAGLQWTAATASAGAEVVVRFEEVKSNWSRWVAAVENLPGRAFDMERWGLQIRASAAAALEGAIELLERLSETVPAAALDAAALVGRDRPNVFLGRDRPGEEDLDLFVRTTANRLEALDPASAGPPRFSLPPASMAQLSSDGSQRYLDWHRPENLRARLILERLRVLTHHYDVRLTDDDDEMVGNLGIDADIFRTIDGDRYASARLALESAATTSLVDLRVRLEGMRLRVEGMQRTMKEGGSTPLPLSLQGLEPSLRLQTVPPLCNAHRDYPLFAIAAIEAEALRGGLNRAVTMLRTIRDGAQGPTLLETQRAAERGLVRLAIRFSITDEPGVTFGASLAESPALDDLALRTTLNVLEGARSTDLIRAAVLAASDLESSEALDHLLWLLGTPVPESPLASGGGEANERSYGALNRGLMRQLNDAGRAAASRLHQLSLEGFEGRPLQALTLQLRILAFRPEMVIPDEIIACVGLRRAADFALVEGMTLGRRFGARCGLPLFELARGLFERCADPVGAFLAELRLTLARIEAREVPQISALAKKYEALRGLTPELPEWGTLVQIAGSETDDDPTEADKAERSEQLAALAECGYWRPCLIRTVGALICAREARAGKPRGAALVREWIAQNYATQREDRLALAPDLASWAGSSVRGTFWRRVGRVVWQVGMGLIGLALIGAIGLGFVVGLQKAVSTIGDMAEKGVGVRPGEGWIILGLCVAGAIAFFYKRLVPWLCYPLTRFCVLRLSVVPFEGPADPAAPLRKTLLYRREAEFFGAWRWRLDDPSVEKLMGPGRPEVAPLPYAQLPDCLPAAAAADLRASARVGLPEGWQMRLELDPNLTAVAWEAAIGLAAGPTTFADVRYVCRRTLPAAEKARLRELPRPLHVDVWTGDEYLQDAAARVWESESAAPAFRTDFVSPLVELPRKLRSPFFGQTDSNRAIVHLLGAPRETSLGVVLALESERQRALARSERARSESVGETSEGAQALQAASVIEQAPGIQLCIVQAPLDEEIGRRNQQRREEAGLLRRFGSELFKTGIPAVLVLPPLTEDLHGKVFALLCTELARPENRETRHWLRILRAVQKEIAAGLAPVPGKLVPESASAEELAAALETAKEAALEVAFDACLYLTDGFTWQLASATSEPPSPEAAPL